MDKDDLQDDDHTKTDSWLLSYSANVFEGIHLVRIVMEELMTIMHREIMINTSL